MKHSNIPHHEFLAYLSYLSQAVSDWYRRFLLVILLLTLSTLTIFSQVNPKFTSNMRSYFTDRAAPLLKMIGNAGYYLSQPGRQFQETINHMHSYAALQEENNFLRQHYLNFQKLEIENQELRKLMHFIDTPSPEYVTTRVVGDTTIAYGRTVLAIAGSSDNVLKNQSVVNPEGLVGRVMEVGRKSCRIMLITDMNARVPVISMVSREKAIAAGNNTEKLEILYLPKNTITKPGELVVTAGDGEFFPVGVPVGVVSKDSNDKLYIAPIVTFNKLDYISIVSKL